jgi:uncharacterized membrane protein
VTRDTVLAFGVIMLLCSLSFALLRASLIAADGPDSPVAKATARSRKGLITIIAYVVAIGVVFISPTAAIVIYFAVAALWLVPDRRFEQLVS